MPAQVFHFASHENTKLDTTRIMVLRQSLGDQRCREVVEEVVFHLADRLGLLEAALHKGDVAGAATLASRLAGLSEQVGLADFTRVSRDLCQCLRDEDMVATAAVAARLSRLGEDSLFDVIMYADQTAL